MTDSQGRLLLVGDNPFHGISHISQERASQRGQLIREPQYAADIVTTALRNGAGGFTFTVDDTTLEIVRLLSKNEFDFIPRLYAFVPYTYEYVRLAVSLGGIPGLARKIATQILLSGNTKAIWHGIRGGLTTDPSDVYKAYLYYEVGRIRAAARKTSSLNCVFVHEVVTDMALALDMKWLFNSHIAAMNELGIRPGFHTRNLPFLLEKFGQWKINSGTIILTTPFNAIGMQMNPSKLEAEQALREANKFEIIVFGILAGGLLQLDEAMSYIDRLTNVNGIAVGVSKKEQAKETFKFISSRK